MSDNRIEYTVYRTCRVYCHVTSSIISVSVSISVSAKLFITPKVVPSLLSNQSVIFKLSKRSLNNTIQEQIRVNGTDRPSSLCIQVQQGRYRRCIKYIQDTEFNCNTYTATVTATDRMYLASIHLVL